MKKRMAILMSMAIAANMIASVPVCAADIFTDSMTTDSAITQEADDDSFSDGSGTDVYKRQAHAMFYIFFIKI